MFAKVVAGVIATAIATIAAISMVLQAVLALLVVPMAAAVVIASRQEGEIAACVALIGTVAVIVVVAIHDECHRKSRCHMIGGVAVAKTAVFAGDWG